MSATVRFRRIKEIYLQVVDQKVDRREQVIAEACGNDTELAAEVLRLLALSDEPTGSLHVMDLIAGDTARGGGPGARDEIADALLARLDGWDRFTRLELIGAGGMGIVFRAHDPRLKRPVALKFLNRLSARAAKRFRREAELQARVDHDHVLDVYETGDVAGQPFLAMKWVDGCALTGIRKETTLQAKLEIMAKITEAVHAGHGLGLIHRDLKPSNILVERTPRGLKPWVSDFGIAAELGGPALTGTFLALGSPRYMAPEQLDEGARLDPRTDVYGLGATFYELLAGAPPFRDDSIIDLLIKVRNDPAPPLALAAPDTPPQVSAVVMRCLEKEPARRYPTAAALAADLRRLANRQATSTDNRWLSGRRWINRRPVLAAAIVLILIGLAAFAHDRFRNRAPGPTAAGSDTVVRPAPRRVVAVAEPMNLSARPESQWLSVALCELLTSELAQGASVRLVPGERVAQASRQVALVGVRPLAADSLVDLHRSLGAEILVRGAFLSLGPEAGGAVRLDLRVEQLSEGIEAGSPLALVTEQGTETDLPELVLRAGAKLRSALGAAARPAGAAAAVRASFPGDPEAGRLYAEGLSRLRRYDAPAAKDLLRQALTSSPNHPMVHLALSRAWTEVGRYAEAEAAALRASELSEDLLEIQRLEIEAHYHRTRHDWPRAIGTYRRLWRQRGDEIEYGLSLAAAQIQAGESAEVFDTLDQLRQLPPPASEDPRIDVTEASATGEVSDFEASAAAAQRARQRASAKAAPHVVIRALMLEAWALRNLSQFEAALAASDQAKIIAQAAGDPRGVSSGLAMAAASLKLLGRFDEAVDRYRQALSIATERGDLYVTAAVSNNLAVLLGDRGDLDRALDHYQRALAIQQQLANPSRVALVEINIGFIHALRGHFARALELYETAIASFRQLENHRGVAVTQRRIAEALTAMGELIEAAEHARDGLETFRRLGARDDVATMDNVLGVIRRLEGDPAGAIEHHRRALEVNRELGSQVEVASSLIYWGLAELESLSPTGGRRSRQLAAAEGYFEEAETIATELGLRRWTAEAWQGRSRVFLERGEMAASAELLERTLDRYRELDSRDLIAAAHLDLSRLEVASGHYNQAASAARAAVRGFRDLGLAHRVAEAEDALALALRPGGHEARRPN